MVLSRADTRHGSIVSENILIFISSEFKIYHVWDELKRKLIQNKIEKEKLTFKLELV